MATPNRKRRSLLRNAILRKRTAKTDKRKRIRLRSGLVTHRPLYQHQIDGILALSTRRSFANFDDPGLGKTTQAIYAAADLIKRRIMNACIVACPSDIISVWHDEIKACLPGVKVQVISGATPFNKRALRHAHFYVVNYELLSLSWNKNSRHNRMKRDGERLMRLMSKRKVGIVCDEAHAICNITAGVTKALCYLGTKALWRVILTGTPVEKPEDIWALFYFLDAGKTFGTSFDNFVYRWCKVNEYRKKWGLRNAIVGYKNLTKLANMVDKHSIRRLKADCLDLPPKMPPMRKYIHASGKHHALMCGLREEALEVLAQSLPGEFNLQDGGKLSRIMHDLMRAAVCPWVVDPEVTDSNKFRAILGTFTQFPNALIWVYHRDVSIALAERLREEGVPCASVYGGMPQDQRTAILDRFSKGAYRAVVTTSALKQGRTITCTQHAVYAELFNKRRDYAQSIDRIHRIGTKGAVTIDVPMLVESADVMLWEKLQKKVTQAAIIEDGGQDDVITTMGLKGYLESW